ncbi:MAG: hypothetical protein ACSHX3_04505 [Litorimonas sp.]
MVLSKFISTMALMLIAASLFYSNSTSAQDFSDPAVQQAEAAKAEKYANLFAVNADGIDNETVLECSLHGNLTVRAALPYFEKGVVSARQMMTLNTTLLGWSKLQKLRFPEEGFSADGALHKAVKSGDVDSTILLMRSLEKVCGQHFDGVVRAAEKRGEG